MRESRIQCDPQPKKQVRAPPPYIGRRGHVQEKCCQTASSLVLQHEQLPPSPIANRHEFASDAIRGACHKFSIGAADERNVLVGVAVVGRPVARLLQDGLTLTATTDIRTCGIPGARQAIR